VKFIIAYAVLAAITMFSGCTKPQPGAALNPVQSAGCAVETAVTTAAAGSIMQALSCTNESAIEANLMTALGNVDMCATPLPAVPAAPSALMSAKALPKFTKIGDITAGDLQSAKAQPKALLAKPMGIVGAIACPIVVNTVIGFATSEIPSAWGCSASAGADTVGSALTAACEAAVPL
jgi:hypothetical protein